MPPEPAEDLSFPAMPFPLGLPPPRMPSPTTPVVADEGALRQLLGQLLMGAGFTIGEAARRLGVSRNGFAQYLNGHRVPGLFWFVKVVSLCGGRVVVEFPRPK